LVVVSRIRVIWIRPLSTAGMATAMAAPVVTGPMSAVLCSTL